jgi:hypothetical protein
MVSKDSAVVVVVRRDGTLARAPLRMFDCAVCGTWAENSIDVFLGRPRPRPRPQRRPVKYRYLLVLLRAIDS